MAGKGTVGGKSSAKGKGATGRRQNARAAKFNPKTGGAKANVLRDEPAEAPAARKRAREETAAAPPAKVYKQGPFARPAPAPRAEAEPQPALSKKELKQQVEARKSASKPNFALIQELMVSWEKLRRSNVTAEERSRLTSEVAAKAKGRARTLATSHKASRVLQSVLKHGTEAEAASVRAELFPDLPALAKDPYACHLVVRLIEGAPKPELARLVVALRPHAPRLARHPFAAPALDALYGRLAGAAPRAALLSDFYGPSVALARNAARAAGAAAASVTLAGVLASQSGPQGRQAVLQRLGAALTPILEKGLVSFAFVHRLLAEYLGCCGPQGVSDAALSVAGPALLRMIHTPDGAKAASRLLAATTAKERKACLKALKGRVCDVARDACGHIALLAALECVDDTALLGKAVLDEMTPQLGALARHRTARRLLLNLLAPRSPRYLPPDVLAALPPLVASRPEGEAEAAEGEDEEDEDDDDEHGIGAVPGAAAATSKKPSALRRAQLLQRLGSPLLAACAAAAPALLRHPHGCDVLFECARAGGEPDGPIVTALPAAAAAADALRAAVVAAAAAAGGAEAEEGEGEGEAAAMAEPPHSSFHATRTLRRLALDSPAFASALWAGALAGKVRAGGGVWGQGHGAKVLAACVAAGDARTRAAAAAELKAAGLLTGGKSAAEWAAAFVNSEAHEAA